MIDPGVVRPPLDKYRGGVTTEARPPGQFGGGNPQSDSSPPNAIPEAKMGWILFAANHAARYHGLDGGFQFTLDTGGVS